MTEIILTCPRCWEPVVVPVTDTPFKGHICPPRPLRRFFAAVTALAPRAALAPKAAP